MLQNTLTYGNYLVFPAILAKVREMFDKKHTS